MGTKKQPKKTPQKWHHGLVQVSKSTNIKVTYGDSKDFLYILYPQELPKLLQDLGTTDADLPWNKSKNRFPNIKPCT